jgi:hypothetical protein
MLGFLEQGTHANIMHVKVIMHGDMTHAMWQSDLVDSWQGYVQDIVTWKDIFNGIN